MTLIRSPLINLDAMDSLLNDLNEIFTSKVDLEKASIIDTYKWKEGSYTYKQFVYRLADKSIYVETKIVEDENVASLQKKLEKAVKDQRFEDAARYRDELTALSKQ